MVLDGAADEMRLYVNGLRVATGSQVGYPAGNTAGLVLGMSPSEGHFFGGVIDDVDVFSRALTDQEISAIFNSGTAGKCGCPSQLSCDDGNVCTIDGCLASTGECTHTNSDYPCDDANACATGDTCGAGACMGGPALPCDDFNACTTDSCDPSFGCFYQDNTPLCDDGSACTLDTCDPGTGLCAHQVIPIEEVPTLDFLDYLILQWPQTPDASSWNTYRGTIPARYLGSRPPGSVYDHVCLESGDEHGDGPTISLDPSSPPLGTAYYYDITGENACGEGPLGMDSSGIVRPNARPCP